MKNISNDINEIYKSERLSYGAALNQGLRQAMELSQDVIAIGQLIDYQPGVFGSTTGLVEQFGVERVKDFPVSESAMTSIGLGAAISGLRPVLIHHRLDFMLYSVDAIVNWLALWRFKSNGKSSAPMVIRAIVGKGWGQGPQHSKSLHSWFAHVPGLNVIMPATPFDAKGMLLEAIFGENPVIIIEHRSLYSLEDLVPQIPYRIKFGKAVVRKTGSDLTVVAIGEMVPFAIRISESLEKEGIYIEVIDLRSISPIDKETIIKSVLKTKRLCVMDPAWQSFGVSGEIIAIISESICQKLLSHPIRICYPDSHTPMSSALEDCYYPEQSIIINQIKSSLGLNKAN